MTSRRSPASGTSVLAALVVATLLCVLVLAVQVLSPKNVPTRQTASAAAALSPMMVACVAAPSSPGCTATAADTGVPPIGNAIAEPAGTCMPARICQNGILYARSDTCVDQILSSC